jgi:hypothetical protein
MRHYRINKLAKTGGIVIKRRDVLAGGDKQAIDTAARDPECPVCEVWRDGEKIGSID